MKTLPAIIRHLATRDPKLKPALKDRRPFAWAPADRDLYLTLIGSIISQQLSNQAAETIHGRLLDLFPKRHPDPKRLLAMTLPTLRAAGVSKQKAGYLKNVARFALKGGLDRSTLAKLSDDELIDHLTQIKGVGRWTAEMLLMFSLNRPDVLPVDDVGIQNAMKALYGIRLKGPRLRRRMVEIGEAWRPYRTWACKFLWRWRGAQQSA